MPRAGFEPLHELLTGQPIESLCQIAEREREAARQEAQEAERRGDTRRIRAARDRLEVITRECLRGAR